MSKISPRDVYELVENDKGEIMILIYAKDPAPQNATFSLSQAAKILRLNRTPKDILTVAGLDTDAVNKLSKIKQLYVCEIKYKESSDDESEIIHAYAATLKKEQSAVSNTQTQQAPVKTQSETISEKAQKAREKALKKANK